MELNRKRCILTRKIAKELQSFKRDMSKKKATEVMEEAYRIVCIISIYEMLLEMSQDMSMDTVQELIKVPGVLSYFYDQWLKIQDSFEYELQDCIVSEVSKICMKNKKSNRGNGYDEKACCY